MPNDWPMPIDWPMPDDYSSRSWRGCAMFKPHKRRDAGPYEGGWAARRSGLRVI